MRSGKKERWCSESKLSVISSFRWLSWRVWQSESSPYLTTVQSERRVRVSTSADFARRLGQVVLYSPERNFLCAARQLFFDPL
jgi:hypothetical protein